MKIQMQYLLAGDASKKLNISVDTIRRWDKKGLIKSQRDSRNARIFPVEEISRLLQKKNGEYTENRYKILKTKKKSNITTLELFAGAGGTALGMENAGISHVLLNEIDKSAAETLRSNRPDWNIVPARAARSRWHSRLPSSRKRFDRGQRNIPASKRQAEAGWSARSDRMDPRFQ